MIGIVLSKLCLVLYTIVYSTTWLQEGKQILWISLQFFRSKMVLKLKCQLQIHALWSSNMSSNYYHMWIVQNKTKFRHFHICKWALKLNVTLFTTLALQWRMYIIPINHPFFNLYYHKLIHTMYILCINTYIHIDK